MNDLAVGSSASMLKSSQDIQATSAMKVINSGVSTANAASATMGSGDGSQLRAETMQSQGIGQKLDVTA